MKKFIIFSIVALYVMFLGVEAESHDCPPGYSCPTTTIIDLCPPTGCLVEVEWCCFDGVSTTTNPVFYINSIKFLGDPFDCPCLTWAGGPPPALGYPIIELSKILNGIIMSGICCASQALLNIPNCENGHTLQIAISNGGCYEFVNTHEFKGYRLCEEPTDLTICKKFFRVCKKLVNGVWTLEIESDGVSNPIFTCDPGCHPICEFTY